MATASKPTQPQEPEASPSENGATSWFGAFQLNQTPNQEADGGLWAADWLQGSPEKRAKRFVWDRLLSRSPVPDLTGQNRWPFDVHTLQRVYSTFIAARVGLGLVLVGVLLLNNLMAREQLPWSLAACIAYSIMTLAVWWLGPATHIAENGKETLRYRHWLATIGIDLLAFTTLHAFSPLSNLNYQAFLVIPVLMSGLLTSQRAAFSVAALAALALLGVGWWHGLHDNNTPSWMMQAGLFGASLFALSFLCGELAQRIETEGLAARGSIELARQQAQLNRLMIDEMQEGVLVVDRVGRVRAANPAARRLLVAEGIAQQAPFQLKGIDDWAPLVQAVEQAFAQAVWPDVGHDVALPLTNLAGNLVVREVRLRMRFTHDHHQKKREDLCVLFIEDVRTVHARLRQEKLAAMGRMSAGIAHEIRNPLAAIAQANALLAEDAEAGTQQRLTTMVADNVARLKRIVDDVLAVAPGIRQGMVPIECAALIQQYCLEWQQTVATTPYTGLAAEQLQQVLTLQLTPEAQNWYIRFESDHLRRVMVNLLDNAWRHGTQTSGAMVVRTALSHQLERPTLLSISVCSDGPPIPAEVEESLFEPFFSTRSRGTGLGLYICRELCERYGARIDYRQHAASTRHRNEFIVTIRAEGRPAALDTAVAL